jgi:Leucine-rich repeat (LRR) protein
VRFRYFLLCCPGAALLPLMLIGCSGDSSPTTPAVVRLSAEQNSAIDQINAAGGSIKKNPDGSVAEVNLSGVTLSPELLTHTLTLKPLRSLVLVDSSFSDTDLPTIEPLADSLANLDVRGCSLSDAAGQELAKYRSLRALRLSGKNGKTSMGDEGVKPLAKLISLKVLALDDLFVGIDGITPLTALKDLEELYLANTTVDDDTCKVIAGFPKLRKLRLARTSVGDAALEHLKSCKLLVELDLSENTIVTNAGLAHLGQITTLTKLNLWRLAVSDDGILNLASLTNLNWLNLDNTQLSDAGLAVLKDMNKLTFLHLGSTQVTAQGAPSLYHLTSLKDLKITRTALGSDDTAVAELKAKLPDTTIQTEYLESPE